MFFIMHSMGFPHTWINWIRECLQSPYFSVMINGAHEGYFPSSKGIKQDDPISPYFSVIVMEYWSIQMELAMA